MSRSDRDRSREQARDMAAMFDKVAPRYDFLNRVLSLRRDRGWRRRAVTLARLDDGETALDVGVGTGDLAFELLGSSAPTSRVVGIDVSERMLVLVRARARASADGARFEARAADAHALPFADRSFDRVVAGFAVRNFGDLDAGLREMRRVLRPGGRAVILEFSHAPNPLVRAVYRLYVHGLVPRVAALLGGDAAAYRYLPESMERFPGAERLAERLRAAGFSDVTFERLTLGTVAIHVAEA
jgi:demethylmenaquinone methyltransferase/2-methoxy-6-polyprenyl-1,4-benzoquinol methylase